MNWAIETENLSKFFGTEKALRDLNLRVPAGCIFGFLGENGAGKSTAMKCILGLQNPTRGTIRLFGQSLKTQRNNLMRRIGALIESPSFYGHLSGIDNMQILCWMRSLPLCCGREALAMVGLSDRASQRVSHYSHGMKQRLGIAMALLGNPELVILDEPTNGLDPSGIKTIRELILSLPERWGATVLISSHLLAEVERLASNLVIMKAGRQLFGGTLDDLRARSGPSITIRSDQPKKALSLLKRWTPVLANSGEIHISGDDHLVPLVNRALLDAGIAVSFIGTQNPKLEDIYFTFMKETS